MASALPADDAGMRADGLGDPMDVCYTPSTDRKRTALYRSINPSPPRWGPFPPNGLVSPMVKARLAIDRSNRDRRRDYLFGAEPGVADHPPLPFQASRKRRALDEVHEPCDDGYATGVDLWRNSIQPCVPGTFPEISGQTEMVMEDADASTEHQPYLMSGALPPTPTSRRRRVASISPDGTDIPAAYPQMDENCSLQRVVAETPTPQGEADQDGQNTGSLGRRSWISWTDTIVQTVHRGVHRLVETFMRVAINYAGSFKRRAVGIFQSRSPQAARRRGSPTTSASPTFANIRALPEDQRRRVRSHRWRRDRGHPTIEHYPFPELNFDKPHIAAPSPAIAEEAPPSRQVHPSVPGAFETEATHSRDADLPIPGAFLSFAEREATTHLPPSSVSLDATANHPIEPIEPVGRKLLGQVSANIAQASFLVPPLAPWLHPAARVEDSVIAVRQPSIEEDKENEPPAPEPEVSYPEPLVPDHLEGPPPLLFGPAVSAVNLVRRHPRPIPPGRTESLHAREWRQMEKKRLELERLERKTRVRIEGPAVQALTPECEARIVDIIRLPNSRKVASTLSGDPLTRKDLASCYIQGSWLNDEVINAYLAILVDYLRRSHGNAGRHDKPLFHAFNTFFFSNLRDKGYQSVRRWANRAKIGGEDLLNVDTVFIPVHNHAHWTLMVVKPSERTIENFDSLGSVSKRHVDLVKTWLRGELGASFVEEEWAVLGSESPQQTNGSDCGAFLLSTAKAVAVGIDPLSYGPEDIPLLRLKIVAEVVNGGLDGDFEPLEGAL